VRQLINLITGL